MVFVLLPVFIVDKLGGSYKSFGLLEGSVIFLSFVAKLFAGFLMDIFKRKKPMLFTGTILTVLSKLFLAFSFSVFFAFIAKSIDRFAKGLRHAPIDAILAEIAVKKGFAYSIRHMMNVLGSLLGSVLTSLILIAFEESYRLVFILSVVPTLIALYILIKKISYKEERDIKNKEKYKWNVRDIKLMPREYWDFIIMVAILMFNRFSEGFITLRAKEVLPHCLSNLPIFMALYEICVIAVSIPVGKLADRIDKRIILIYGISVLFIADIFGMFANNFLTIICIYIFAGIHMGATQGIISAIVAKTAPKHLIGTAFAIYYGVDGITLFFSNYLAGIAPKLAIFIGFDPASGPFIIGSIASFSALIYVISLVRRNKLALY